MGKFFAVIFLSFLFLLVIHIIFLGINVYLWTTEGLEALLQQRNVVETIYFSVLLKWLILADVVWLSFAVGSLLKRKKYKTGPEYYLSYEPIKEPIVAVIIPTFNEAKNVEKVVKDYKSQPNVKYVFVVDNNSTDNTPDIAEKYGVTVIRKKINKGFGDSCVIGFNEVLKTDANVIVLTECDGTFNGYDITKMIPYLDNCDMVVGTRIIQVLTEKGNQNGMFNTWGNFFIGKLIQLKYFSLLHMGVTSFTDVGCAHRCIRRDGLEKMIEEIRNDNKNNIDKDGWMFLPYLNLLSIESELKTVEVPITFNKRSGISKSGANIKSKGIKLGLRIIWLILVS
jgi:glycosyltransferase involved in cell wall biosynthesis